MKMEEWKTGTARFLDAKNTALTIDLEASIAPDMIFDLENEDEEFLRNFNMPISFDNVEGTDQEGTEEEVIGDDLNAQNYVGMEVGLRRGGEGDLQRGNVKR